MNDNEEKLKSSIKKNSLKARENLTNTIMCLIVYANLYGSSHSNQYYLIFTQMIYREVFNTNNIKKKNLNHKDLFKLMKAEILISEFIKDALNKKIHYKDIYKLSKKYLRKISYVLL